MGNRLGLYLVLVGFVVYTAVMSYLSILRHNAFWSSYDLANMDQTVWQTSQGRVFQLTGDKGMESRFGHHADLVLIILAPLYWVWNDPRMLLVVQTIALGIGGVLVYLIAKKVVENEIVAAGVSFLYWLNPGLLWTNIYDFHPVALAVPLIFGVVLAQLNNRIKIAIVLTLLALLTKENVGLWLAVWWGVLWLRKRNKLHFFVAGVSGGWSILMVFGLMPMFSRSSGYGHWAWSWYRLDGLLNIFSDPLMVFKYVVQLVMPFGFLPLLSPISLLPAFPDFILNVLSSQGQMKSVNFHYDVLINIAVVMATIYLMRRLKDNKSMAYLLLLFTFIFGIRQNYYYSPLPTTPGHWWPMYQVGEEESRLSKYLASIPDTFITTASSELRPHVNHRLFSYNLPNGIKEADYVVMSLRNRLTGDVEIKDYENKLNDILLKDTRYKLEFIEKDFRVYHRLD